MILNLSEVKFNNNDIKNGVKIPKKLDEHLAHFIGIHLGDGHLNKKPQDYRMCYNGHYVNEYEWYDTYLTKLVKLLFNKEVKLSKGHNTIQIVFSSKAIHFFLNGVCQLPIGAKKNCDVPNIIKNANMTIKRAFLRGMADTDFSLVFKNRHKKFNYYPVIDHQTSNKKVNDSIIKLLLDMGFKVHHGERMKKRRDKAYQSYYFQINGKKGLKKWMDEIGFTNSNQLTKLEVWKKFGHLPPKTNIKDRIAILDGKKIIDSHV
ncbi:hypothetical protein CEE44_03735 [Candidatus Woesearchaeota archaeon B3_Woes]|nr:MAG: hypothetical protein CEE44_03735 [Candidatus Woesearchaeota archaeon B3_Woes]